MSRKTTEDAEYSLSDIQHTLSRHDGIIGNFSGRISGLESGLNSAVAMMKEMRDETAKAREETTRSIEASRQEASRGFETLRTAMIEIKSEQGPGIGKLLGYLVGGAALIGMASGGITILVTSFVSPDIVKLKTVGERHETYLEQTDRAIREEYRDLKRAHDKRIQERLERIEERLGAYTSNWAATTTPAKPAR